MRYVFAVLMLVFLATSVHGQINAEAQDQVNGEFE